MKSRKFKPFTERRPKGMSRAGWMMCRGTFKALYMDRQRAAAKAATPEQPSA